MDRKTVSKFPALLVSAALIAAPVMTFAQSTTEPAAPDATTTEPMAPDATMPEATTPDATMPDATTPEATPEVMPAPADPMADPAAPAVDPAAGAYVVPEGYVAVADMTTLTADSLMGVNVVATDGSNVGEISDVELSAEGAVTGLILDVGGFLGMGTHTVKLMMDQVSFYENADKDLIAHVPMDKAALEALPEYEAPAG